MLSIAEEYIRSPDRTGISTYLLILTNRKEPERKGKIQLIDARQLFVKMRKSLGNKRNETADGRSRTIGPSSFVLKKK